MAKFSEFTFPSCDGAHEIVCSLWLPDEGHPKAVVQIVHGISEYVNRYDQLARYLAEKGYAVCGEDHLGHGRTAKQDSKFGFFAAHDGWTLVTSDVRQLRQRMGEQYPGIPYFLLGHSMGSFLTRTYLCRYPGEVDGAILSGTGQEPPLIVGGGKLLASLLGRVHGPEYISPLVHSLALGAYNKQFAPNRTTADWITRDEAVVDAYMADPFCQIMPTVSLYRDMLGGLQYIASCRALSQMNPDTPVYIYSGDQDAVGANGAGVRKVHSFFRQYGTKDLTLKLYPDGRHEMHNELNREEVFADVLAWLEQHI
jgi:alpha-beta hydrolase superfamily lysophospholipase